MRASSKRLVFVLLTSLWGAGLLLGAAPAQAQPAKESASASGNEQLAQATVAVWKKSKELIDAGKYQEAVTVLTQLKRLLEKNAGADHALTVQTNKYLALAEKMLSASKTAAAAQGTVGTTPVAAVDLERTQAAVAKAKAALSLWKDGKYPEAVTKLDAALDVLEFTLGPDHELVETYRKILVIYFTEMKKDPAALARIEDRSKRAREQRASQPKEQPITAAEADAMQQMMQAMAAFSAYEFERSRELFEKALPQLEERLSKDLKSKVMAQVIFARLNDYSLRYDRAEKILVELLAEVDQKEGRDSPLTVQILQALIALYQSRGTWDATLPYSDRLVAQLRGTQPQSPELVDALRDRALARMYAGDVAGAFSDLGAAQSALKANQPIDQVRMAQLLDTSRMIARVLGDEGRVATFDEAACMLGRQSTDPQVKLLTEDSCAAGALRKGDWATADRMLSERLQATEARAGVTGAYFWLNTASELSRVRFERGEMDDAHQLMQKVLAAQEERMQRELTTGSDAQKREKFTEYRSELYHVLELAVRAPEHEGLRDLGLETLLRRKGRAVDAEADAARAARLLTGPDERRLLERQQEVRALMAGLTLKGEGAPTGQLAEKLKQLEAQDAKISRELVEKSSTYRALFPEVTVQGVSRKIPARTALVEFASFVRSDPKTGRPVDMRYLAYVVQPGREPALVDLGDARPVLDGVDDLRAQLVAKKPVETSAEQLHGLLLSEVRKKLAPEVERLLIAPDDALNLVPFAALLGEEGRYLVEDFEVDYLSSGRDLLRLDTLRPARSAPLVVGDPEFSAGVKAGSAASRSGDLASVHFGQLPGTREEVEAVEDMLAGARLLTGSAATKEALRSVHGPSVLHVATHGFFLDMPDAAAEQTRGLKLTKASADQASPAPASLTENPLIRSGLAFSGANRADTASGILAALEAATLDLDGTRLVVLSACETGLGTTNPGEGVYGLRRAFFVAGSETQLMSLWKVDDAATRDWMVSVYERLQSGKARGAAVRQAQLKMLESEEHAHPYYWAAFIVSGNVSPMDFTVQEDAAAAETAPSSGGSRAKRRRARPRIPTISGSKWFLYGRGNSLTNLLDQNSRVGLVGGLQVEVSLLSYLLVDSDGEGRTGFAVHDAAFAGIEVGGRVSEADVYPSGDKEGGWAAGYDLGYEVAVGGRAKSFGILGGVRPRLRGLATGSATSKGWMLPGFALLEVRPGDDFVVALSGWYGSPLVDGEALGGQLDLGFGDVILRLGVDQTKLKTRVGGSDGDDRLEAGDQVNTAYTLAIGGRL